MLELFLWGLERKRVVVAAARLAKQPGGIGSLESILGLLKGLKVRALAGRYETPIPSLLGS